ncbi:MAG: SCO family protein [Pseudomonadota bacterium]
MNITLKPPFTRSFALAALAALSLSACVPDAAVPQEPPLAGADIGGPFTLTSSTGDTVSWEDFRGKYAVVYFGYAYCPDVCPTDMQRTAQGLREFAEQDASAAAKVQAVFITIDPERDTQEVVGEFTSAFSDDLMGLTGSPEAIKQAADAFRVYYKKGEETESGAYLVDHTNIVYLFDPAGEPLAMLPTNEGADAVAAELAKWVN